MSSFLTEAAATLEYSQPGQTGEFGLGADAKTVDLIGEEFIKKGEMTEIVTAATTSSATFVQSSEISSASLSPAPMMSGALPPLTYTTTATIPTIASQPGAQGGEEAGVLYCNLDDLSRYIPDNFSFDGMLGGGAGDSIHASHSDNVSVQVLSLPSQVPKQTIQTISFPNSYQRPTPGSTVQIQVDTIFKYLMYSEMCTGFEFI